MSPNLAQYSDREIAQMMKECCKRMELPHAMSQSDIRDLYDEYRKRSDDRADSDPPRRYAGSHKQ